MVDDSVPVQRLSDAKPAGKGHLLQYIRVYAVQCTVQCREPKPGQQKVQLLRKTEHFAPLGILFI